MPFVPTISVRAQLILAILLAITLSWVLSAGITNYLTYQQITALRQQMLQYPERFPEPLPAPRFGPYEFFFGYRPGIDRPFPGTRPPQPNDRQGVNPPPDQRFPPDEQPPITNTAPDRPAAPANRMGSLLVAVRIGTALLLALLAGLWLSRRFTAPLAELAKGAHALNAGQYTHRVPVHGVDEFAEVATAMNEMATRVSTHIAGLEEEARRRRQFLADMAHELRAPVTTLRTMAGALEEGVADDPERQQRAIHVLARTSDRLLHLVTDLLELARLDLHELPLHRQPVDARELAGECVQAHIAVAERAGIMLHPVATGMPVMVHADADRLAQILNNLLNNAISHAGTRAEVRVTITDGTPVRLIVADTGRGIPAQHLPFLFDPFYRVDTARTPGDQHSGLGLRIARALVLAHGGTLTVASKEGHGTRAEITLPAGK